VPARPRRGALGLRGRIVGAVLVTTVATLLVAALALLGPLENSLRNAALKTLLSEGTRATAPFKALDLSYYAALSPKDKFADAGQRERNRVAEQQAQLATQIGATVTLLGYFDQSGHGAAPVAAPAQSAAVADSLDDAAKAYLRNRPVKSFASSDGTEYAQLALPIENQDHRFVLIVRKPIDEIPGAVHAVRTAFITAALVCLALTLILAIPLAATLVRRLRRLRVAALQLASNAAVVDVPEDRRRDEVGDLSRAFSIMQDRLQQQEEARRAFVATASHELRTPLTSLEGMLELIEEDLSDPQPDLTDARALLARARAQSRRLGRLAADLLDLSRIDAQVQLRSEPVELGELSRAVLAEFELASAERGVAPMLDDSSGPVWARADPGSVARILRILLENAVRVSPSGGAVTVELRNGRRAELRVCDEGPGVAPEERELIFERFQRGRNTHGQAGFGLGLAIGRELAERMGGELVHEDREPRGAKFTLRLPVERAPESEPLVLT
jgi:signal transduction histidine kinase